MPDEYVTLQNLLMQGVRSINDRPLPARGDLALLPQTEIISADNHWAVTEDVFYENFPAALKDQAPRIWFDGYWRIGKRGGKEVFAADPRIQNAVLKANLQSAWSHDVRQQHLAAEGISKEIIFPQSLLGYVNPNWEVRAWTYWIYNDYIAEQGRRNPTFFGLGLFSNWWSSPQIEQSMEQIAKLGLKGILIPVSPKGPDNAEMSYADTSMDRFWDVVAASGLPICFHIGEPLNPLGGRGSMAVTTMNALAPFRKPLSQLIFGGVLDRHPDLQIVFGEGGIGWVLPWLQDAEALYDTYSEIIERPKRRPSHYWRRNCSATFQADALGLSRLDVLGADRVMWAADYPHTEGTFGFSAKIMGDIVDHIGDDDAKLVLGGNAKRVFKL